jgi:hypothetical protein
MANNRNNRTVAPATKAAPKLETAEQAAAREEAAQGTWVLHTFVGPETAYINGEAKECIKVYALIVRPTGSFVSGHERGKGPQQGDWLAFVQAMAEGKGELAPRRSFQRRGEAQSECEALAVKLKHELRLANADKPLAAKSAELDSLKSELADLKDMFKAFMAAQRG